MNDIIVLIGRVTHVGTTSMEVRVDTYREDTDGTRHPINRAYFVMVAMGDDGKPTPVPPLLLENEGERMEWENAEKEDSCGLCAGRKATSPFFLFLRKKVENQRISGYNISKQASPQGGCRNEVKHEPRKTIIPITTRPCASGK